jgi:iron complex outermembrane recepter protein
MTDTIDSIRKPLATSCGLALVLALALSAAPSDTLRAAESGTGAAATDAATADPADAATEPESIIVTARRREERSQEVPLPISVVNAATLDATGTINVGEVAQLEPTVQFSASNPRNSTLTIRGLGSPFGLTNDGIEPGVGLYVDQVYYARPAATTFDFVDVDQIEILRGPQGTLYGKNTTAGAINVTSLPPSFTPEVDAEVSYGNYDYVQTKESVSGGLLGSTLAGRLGVSYTTRDGTIYDTTTGKNINGDYNIGMKGQLLLHASDTFKATLYADYSYQNPLCCGQLYVGTGSTQRPLDLQFAALAEQSNYSAPSPNPFDRVTDLDAELRATQRFGGTSLLTEWKLGPGTLTSVTAWRYWGWDPANDRDYTGLPITTVSQNPSVQRQWSEEVRYAATSGSIDYVAGLFGFHQSIDTTGLQQEGPFASLWLLSGAKAHDPAILDGLTSRNDIGLRSTSAAVFGQLTWHVTDALRLQPGLRLNYDDKSGKYIATVTNAADTPLSATQLGVLAPQSYRPAFSDGNVSGDFTASYAVVPSVMAYVTYAHSFQSGGINLNGLPLNASGQPITSDATVAPERLSDYEAGLKTQLFDGKVVANLDAFWTTIHDFQTTVVNSQENVIRGYLASAEAARSRGLELDTSAHPMRGLRLYLNGAFTDATYVDFANAPCPPELAGGTAASATHPASPPGTPGGYSPASCNVSGEWLPGVSRWAFSYGIEYSLPIGKFAGGTAAYAGFDGSYRSEFSSNPSVSAYTDVAGYALGNFRAGIRTDSGWDINAWVRNAFNRNYFEFLTTQSANTGMIVGEPGDPRTYGVTVRLSLE